MTRKHRPVPPSQVMTEIDRLIAMNNNLAMQIEEFTGGGQLGESLSDIDWANRVDRDYLWVRASGASALQFRYMTKETIDMYADIANFMAVYNPLIKRIVEVKTQFTFAMNCGITSETLQAEIDAILKDPLNDMAFFGTQAAGDADQASQKDGNIFFAIWKDKRQVRAWSNYEIRDIVLDPEDSARPLFYLRTWLDNYGKEQKRAYPSLFVRDDEIRDDKIALSYLGSSYPVDQEVRVYHMSSRKGIRQKFALSELVAACRWAKPHEKFIEDFHAIASAYRKYSHMMTTKGTSAQASAIAGQFQGDTNQMGTPLQSNPVGSIVVAQEGNELRTISAGSGNIIGIEGARASLMQVCAASGVPETYLTMDPSTGNLATAKEISPVFIMLIEGRQTLWKNALTAVFRYMLESDAFEVSFPPIRDNLNQYILNMNSIAKKPDGSWSGAVRGADYVKAAHEALEWKIPPPEEVEAMGAALEEPSATPEIPGIDTGLDTIAQAANGLQQSTDALKEILMAAVRAEAAKRLQEGGDDVEWITVGGKHIPIEPGQSKGDAVQQALGNKGGGSSGGGGTSKGSGDSGKSTGAGSDGGRFTSSNAEDNPAYSSQEKKSIEKYRSIGGSEYTAINDAARSGKTTPIIKDIDSAIDKSPAIPKGTELYRGLSEKQAATLMSSKVGDSFKQGGYQSYSLDKSVADGFAKTSVTSGGKWSKTLLRIEGDGSTKGIHIGAKEAEVLLGRGQTYTITGRAVEKVKGTKIKVNIITVKVGATS